VQFGGRAAVRGRIGRLRRRDSAEGLGGQAARNGAARPVRAGEDRGGGPGWQGRINAALRAAAGLQG